MNVNSLFKKPYIYWLIATFVLYLFLNILLSGFYKTIPLILKYAATVNWLKLTISIILTLAIGVFVSLNSVLVFIKYKERKACKKESFLTGAGVIGGIATGVCPLCVAGIFPLLLSLFGISFSFALLPFQGIEIQSLVLILLIASFVNLKK